MIYLADSQLREKVDEIEWAAVKVHNAALFKRYNSEGTNQPPAFRQRVASSDSPPPQPASIGISAT